MSALLRRFAIALLCCAGAAHADGDDAALRAYLPPGVVAEREAPTPGPLASDIALRSAALFDAIFAHCDAGALADLVTDDFEFHHDRWGTIARSRSAFVDRIRGRCEDIASGRDPGSRRELVPGTQAVYRAGDDGAIETGVHRFYLPDGHGGEALVGIARYSHLWRREGDAWRVARILSYAHMDVRPASR